jgi:cell division protein FtsL
MVAPERLPSRPRITNVRTAKNASQRRRSHTVRSRYASLRRFSGGLLVVLALVMAYVMLMANLTSLNYKYARAQRQRTELQTQEMRLDNQLATMRSDERLARVAAKLGMQDPQQFAIVQLPVRHGERDSAHLAVLSAISGLFGVK